MKLKSIWSTIIVAGMLTMAFTGCESGSKEDQATVVKLTESGTFPIVEEGEELVVDIFAPLRSAVITYAREENSLTKAFEDKTGLTINWNEVPNIDKVPKLNNIMQSGLYPDVILDHEWSNSEQLLYANQGIIIPIEELIAEHAPHIQAVLDKYPLIKQNMTLDDGHIYSIPYVDATPQTEANYKMWINQVWLDNLGLEMPTTLDEFTEVIRKFRDEDANGNGDPNDEIALTSSFKGWNTNTMYFLLNSFTYYAPNNKFMYIDKNGKLIYTRTTDEFKDGVKYLNSLFEEGLLDETAFTQDGNALKQIGNNPNENILGACSGGYLGSFLDTKDTDRWTDYSAVAPLIGPESVQYAIANPAIGKAVLSITTECPSPEAIIRAWDLFFYNEINDFAMYSFAGVEGVDYVMASEGDLNAIGEPATYTKFEYKQSRTWNLLGPMYQAEDFLIRYTIEGEGNAETTLHQITLDHYTPYLPDDSMILLPMAFSTDESRELVDIETAMNAYFDITFAKFVTGKLDIDENWDEYVAELEKIGLARYLEIYQNKLDAK